MCVCVLSPSLCFVYVRDNFWTLQPIFVKRAVHVHTCTTQKRIVSEINHLKTGGMGGKKMWETTKPHVGCHIKGNFKHKLNIVFVFEKFQHSCTLEPKKEVEILMNYKIYGVPN